MNGLHKKLYQWAINHQSFGPCTFSMWLLMCPIWLNDFGHISQWYGFSPPWSLAWTLRLDFVVNFLPHCWQGKAHRWSSSVCTLMWDLRSEALLKDMVWHRAQLNGFSPVWICVWFFRFPSDRKVFWQVLQTIVAVLWICTMLCFFKGMFTLECLFTNVAREWSSVTVLLFLMDFQMARPSKILFTQGALVVPFSFVKYWKVFIHVSCWCKNLVTYFAGIFPLIHVHLSFVSF